MASQRIRFNGPPGETIDLDIWNSEFPSLGASATHSDINCVEQTPGDYLTDAFTGTLTGRCKISKKVSGESIGIDFVRMRNASETFKVESLEDGANLYLLLMSIVGNQDVASYSGGYYTIQVKDVDDSTVLRTIRYNPLTGDKYIV